MNDTVLDDQSRGQMRAGVVISVRSLLLRVAIAIVTVAALSIGGAWLMHAAIDPIAEAANGAGAPAVESSGTQPGTR